MTIIAIAQLVALLAGLVYMLGRAFAEAQPAKADCHCADSISLKAGYVCPKGHTY